MTEFLNEIPTALIQREPVVDYSHRDEKNMMKGYFCFS